MILNKFGSLTYDGYLIPNLFVNLGLTYDLIRSNFTLREFTIVGSPRPEQLSYAIYGSTDYEWVLLLINNIIDPWYGWIKPDDVVRAYAEKKYKDFGGENGVHHYIDPKTGDEYYDLAEDTVENDHWYSRLDASKSSVQFIGELIPVTNVEFEINENEKLRKIKIIPPSDIRQFLDAFLRTQGANS